MGIFKYFKDYKQQKKIENSFNTIEKQFGSPLIDSIKSQIGNRWSDPPTRDVRGWQELYNRNPRMNPVQKIAETLSCTPIQFEKKDGEIVENEVTDFLLNPNSQFSSSTLFFLTQAWLDVVGECGWLIEKTGRGKPAEAWPIPPHWIYSTPTELKPYFEIYLSEDVSILYQIAPEDFIYFHSPRLINPYGRGIGNVQQIGDEIETDEFMAKYSKRFFYNDATPPILIMADGANDTQRERLRQEWKAKHQGGIDAYEPAFFSSNLKVEVLRQSMKELDFIESRKYMRDSAMEHFGIPKEIFGIVENSNRATIDAAELIYVKYVLNPRFKKIMDTLNRDLVPTFGITDGKLQFENILPEDKEFRLKQANDGFDKGSITADEWRIENGFEAFAGNQGAFRKTALNVIEEPVRSEEQLLIQETTTEEEPIQVVDDTIEEEKSVKKNDNLEIRFNTKDGLSVEISNSNKNRKLEESQRVQYAKALDRGMLKIADAMAVELKKYFNQQEKLFLDSFSDKVKSFKKQEDEITNPDLLTFTVQEALIWKEQNEILAALMTPFYIEGALHGYQIAEDTYNFGLSFDVDVNPEVLRAVNEWGLDKAKGINDTTITQLNAAIEEGISLGESIPLITDRINNVFNQAEKNRSVMIARTEVHNAVNVGTFATYKVAGITQKEWLAVLDERVRNWHSTIDGQIQNIDDPFITGQGNRLMFPGDPTSGVASEIINCRCAVAAVIEV